jgi:hypothetical protein
MGVVGGGGKAALRKDFEVQSVGKVRQCPGVTEKSVSFRGRNNLYMYFNPFTASCETAMSLSVPGVPAPCEKFPHSRQLNFE